MIGRGCKHVNRLLNKQIIDGASPQFSRATHRESGYLVPKALSRQLPSTLPGCVCDIDPSISQTLLYLSDHIIRDPEIAVAEVAFAKHLGCILNDCREVCRNLVPQFGRERLFPGCERVLNHDVRYDAAPAAEFSTAERVVDGVGILLDCFTRRTEKSNLGGIGAALAPALN